MSCMCMSVINMKSSIFVNITIVLVLDYETSLKIADSKFRMEDQLFLFIYIHS